MDLLHILDIVCGIVTPLSLALIVKNRLAWLLYAGNSILFTYLMHCKGLPGQTLMGVFLTIVGIYNYFAMGRR